MKNTSAGGDLVIFNSFVMIHLISTNNNIFFCSFETHSSFYQCDHVSYNKYVIIIILNKSDILVLYLFVSFSIGTWIRNYTFFSRHIIYHKTCCLRYVELYSLIFLKNSKYEMFDKNQSLFYKKINEKDFLFIFLFVKKSFTICHLTNNARMLMFQFWCCVI
jgi:hypothetical protein